MGPGGAVRREVEAIRRRLRSAERRTPEGLRRTARGAARGRGFRHGLRVARALWAGGGRGERTLAVLYLSRFHRAFRASHWGEFKAWVAESPGDEQADLVATLLLGRLVLRDRAWCRVLRHWARSGSVRERRAAAMALLPRTRRMGDAEAALALCEGLMRDRSPSVREAVAALLREARSADPSLAGPFLARWRRSVDRSTALDRRRPPAADRGTSSAPTCGPAGGRGASRAGAGGRPGRGRRTRRPSPGGTTAG